MEASKSSSYASPTFSSHSHRRRSRLAKLEEWRARNRTTTCKTCSINSPNRFVQRLSIQSIAEKHSRKNQVPQIIIPRSSDVEVSPLSMDQSYSAYYDSSSSSSPDESQIASPTITAEESSRCLEKEDIEPNTATNNPKSPFPMNLFSPGGTKGLSLLPSSSSEKENNVQQQTHQIKKSKPSLPNRSTLLLPRQTSTDFTTKKETPDVSSRNRYDNETLLLAKKPRYDIVYSPPRINQTMVAITATPQTAPAAMSTASACSIRKYTESNLNHSEMLDNRETNQDGSSNTVMWSETSHSLIQKSCIVDTTNDNVQSCDAPPLSRIDVFVDDDNWFPEPDYDILSEYDEMVRSVYVDVAAERDSSDDDKEVSLPKTTIEEECPIPESSMRFFREFNIDECLMAIDSSSSSDDDDDENSPLNMFEHRRRRRRNMTLHPQVERLSGGSSPIVSTNFSPTSSCDAANKTKTSPILTCDTTTRDGALVQDQLEDDRNTPHSRSETSSSGCSSPSFVPPRRRRYSLMHKAVRLPQQPPSSSDEDVTSTSGSSSEETSSVDSDDSDGQATVIAEERVEVLQGGLPVHEGKTILTAVPENRAALDVDMVEHRRLAIECRKLRDRLVESFTYKQDMKRDYQKLLVETPKLKQQLVDSCNEVQRLKQELQRFHSSGYRH